METVSTTPQHFPAFLRPPLYDAAGPKTIMHRVLFLGGVFGPMFPVRAYLGVWVFLAAVIGLGVYHIWYMERQGETVKRLGTMLMYLVVYLIGFGSLWGFVGHFFMADFVANNIGWTTGSGFQAELAFYHLAFAGLAGAAVWYKGAYWGAVIVSKAVFLYGAAYTHIVDIIQHANTAAGNAGIEVLWIGDIIIPTLLVVLFFVYQRQSQTAP